MVTDVGETVWDQGIFLFLKCGQLSKRKAASRLCRMSQGVGKKSFEFAFQFGEFNTHSVTYIQFYIQFIYRHLHMCSNLFSILSNNIASAIILQLPSRTE